MTRWVGLELTVDLLLPTQLEVRRGALIPERRLRAAVLEEALHCLHLRAVRAGTSGPRWRSSVRDEAVRWFASDDRRWPFSFLNLCDALDLDPAVVRARLFARTVPREKRLIAKDLCS